jgi:hypothetical protein
MGMIPLAPHLAPGAPDGLTRWIGPPPRPLSPDDPRRIPVGDLFDSTGSILVRHLAYFVALVGPVLVVATLIEAVLAARLGALLAGLGARLPTPEEAISLAGVGVADVVVAAVAAVTASAAATVAAATLYRGEPAPGVIAVYRRVARRLPGLLGLTILLFLLLLVLISGLALVVIALSGGIAPVEQPSGPQVFLVLIAITAWVVALLLLLARVTVALPALILEGKSAIDALGRSWTLTAGSSWRILGIVVATGLVSNALSGIIPSFSRPFENPFAPLSFRGLETTLALQALTTGLAQLVILPLGSTVTTILFLDLRRWQVRRSASRTGSAEPPPQAEP